MVEYKIPDSAHPHILHHNIDSYSQIKTASREGTKAHVKPFSTTVEHNTRDYIWRENDWWVNI